VSFCPKLRGQSAKIVLKTSKPITNTDKLNNTNTIAFEKYTSKNKINL